MNIDESMRKMVEGSNEDVALALNESIVGALITEEGKTGFRTKYQIMNVPLSDTERRFIVASEKSDLQKIDVQVIFHKALIGDDFVVIKTDGAIGLQVQDILKAAKKEKKPPEQDPNLKKGAK